MSDNQGGMNPHQFRVIVLCLLLLAGSIVFAVIYTNRAADERIFRPLR